MNERGWIVVAFRSPVFETRLSKLSSTIPNPGWLAGALVRAAVARMAHSP